MREWFFKHALPSHNLVSTLSINCSKILTFCNFLTYILHFFQKYVEIPFILCYFSIVCYITIQHYSLESLYLNVKRRRCTAVYLLISQAKGQGTINACLLFRGLIMGISPFCVFRKLWILTLQRQFPLFRDDFSGESIVIWLFILYFTQKNLLRKER